MKRVKFEVLFFAEGFLLAKCNLRYSEVNSRKMKVQLSYLMPSLRNYSHFLTYFLITSQYMFQNLVLPWIVTSFSIASRCSFSDAVAWCSQASMSPTYLNKDRNFCVNQGLTVWEIWSVKKRTISYTFLLVQYLRGSWECISIGRGVPPRPPLVRASIKPRTTALLRAVPNSSRVYLLSKHENE